MLEAIKITNLALISKSNVTFGSGFNVLSGETGAGKSLIVDALLFLTGIRADKTLIKFGEDYARVEGVFSVDTDLSGLNDALRSVDLVNEGTLIISRTFSLNGKNECRINGELVTLNILRKVSSYIIDIFGQNDSMLLLNPDNHLSLVDGILEDELVSDKLKLKELLFRLQELNSNIKELGGLDADRENTINLLQFQIDEIKNANLQENEEDELKSKIAVMENSEKIYDTLRQSVEILDGEFPVANSIKTAINTISSIIEFDTEINSEKDRLYSIKYELEDVISNLNSKKDAITYSEYELDMMNDRLSYIKDLERKYGNTISDILNKYQSLQEKLDLLLNADEKLEILRKEKNNYLKEILVVCQKLRDIRKKGLNEFKKKLISELAKLGMKSANFDVEFKNDFDITNIESIVSENGADSVEFMFSANLGVELRPLCKVISGGELSRFMLAFKSLQNATQNRTCIFDEIDAGIGGEIGVVIGQKICDISRTNQVICITHLAQIATFGDTNFKIEKYENETNTITEVKFLTPEQKVIEIARMLGNSTNETSINHSKEIIKQAEDYKIKNL